MDPRTGPGYTRCFSNEPRAHRRGFLAVANGSGYCTICVFFIYYFGLLFFASNFILPFFFGIHFTNYFSRSGVLCIALCFYSPFYVAYFKFRQLKSSSKTPTGNIFSQVYYSCIQNFK